MRFIIEYRRDEPDSHWSQSANRHSDGSGRLLLASEFRSIEAAIAEAQAQQRAHPNLLYRARDTQPELSVVQGGDMTQPVTRAVRLYRRNREWVVDTGGREAPLIAQLTPYLPGSLKGIQQKHCTIVDALTHGVSPQILSSALSAWYVEHPNAANGTTPVMDEGISELPDNNAYLAMGDFIYKMVPVRQAGSSKAVRLMREKVRVEIERVREGLRQQAAQEAQQVISQANTRAAAIRAEAEKLKVAQDAMLKFPQWLSDFGVKRNRSQGVDYALLQCTISFNGFCHGTRHWPLKEGITPYAKAWMWLPLNGNPEMVHSLSKEHMLPHVSTGSACMKIGETVQEITSYDRLLRFQGQVCRALSVINLASLLNANYTAWMPEVQALIPDGIKKWLETYPSRDYQANAEYAAKLPPTTLLERQEETWSVR